MPARPPADPFAQEPLPTADPFAAQPPVIADPEAEVVDVGEPVAAPVDVDPATEPTPAERLASAPEVGVPAAATPRGPRQQRSAQEKAQQNLERAQAAKVRADQKVADLQAKLATAQTAALAAARHAEYAANHPDLTVEDQAD